MVDGFNAQMSAKLCFHHFCHSWLASFVGIEKAIQFGLTPFIYGDILKAALAAGIFPAIWMLFDKSKA